MRPLLKPWMLLLLAAIALMALMIWVRAHPHEREDPLLQAAERLAESVGLEVETQADAGPGVLLKGVRPGSVAAQLGFKPGDRVIAVGDRSVWHSHSLLTRLGEMLGQNSPAPVLVQRGQEYLSIVFGRRGPGPGAGAPGGYGGRAPGASGNRGRRGN